MVTLASHESAWQHCGTAIVSFTERLMNDQYTETPLGRTVYVANVMPRYVRYVALQWRHNDYDCVSNHQPRGCLLNCLFGRRSKKTSKLRVTGLCVGNSPGPVNSPHKGPVTRKMFPFDDVIMVTYISKVIRRCCITIVQLLAIQL